MRFALLGNDPYALELVRAMNDGGEHQLVVAFQTGGLDDELRERAPFATWSDEWEWLLTGEGIDGVIVARGGDPDMRDNQLRKLVQEAVPLLVIHPACEPIVGYELDMIREDTGCVIVPYIPGRLHPVVNRLTEIARGGEDSPIGPLEQIVFERSMSDRLRDAVLGQFARDVEYVRTLLGDVSKINAMGGASSQSPYANLSVHMTGGHDIVARWSVSPSVDEPSAQLALIGARGKATLHMPSNERNWRLEISGSQDEPYIVSDWNGPAAALDNFAAVINGATPTPTWSEACRDAEIASLAEQSVQRGRTIQLYDEPVSEEQTFKGIMAIGGCAIILILILGVFFFAVFVGITNPFSGFDPEQAIERKDDPERWPLWLRLWPVYPLAAFLLLQLLRLVMKRKRVKTTESEGKTDGVTTDKY